MFGLILSVVSIALSVVNIGMEVCKRLGIIDSEVSTEELGDRALQARDEGINIEDYGDRYDEYIDKINSIELNPDKTKETSLEDKQKEAAKVIGTGLLEHYGRDSGVMDFIKSELVSDNKEFYKPERVIAYLDTFKDSNENMSNINRYFEGKLNTFQEVSSIDEELVKAEKKLGVDEEEAKQNIDNEKIRREE